MKTKMGMSKAKKENEKIQATSVACHMLLQRGFSNKKGNTQKT